MMSSTDAKAGFKEIQRFKLEYAPSVITQYESESTGMQVVVIDQKGPKIAGYFVLATEIHDDSGARRFIIASYPIQLLTLGPAHTLEHLVFMVRFSLMPRKIDMLTS